MPGYDVVTVDAVGSGNVCPHCKLVLRDPVWICEEDYHICEMCCEEIYQYVLGGGEVHNYIDCLNGQFPQLCYLPFLRMPNRQCADCGMAVPETDLVFPDGAMRRHIMSLAVKCRHCTSGCPWQGMLKDLEVSV